MFVIILDTEGAKDCGTSDEGEEEYITILFLGVLNFEWEIGRSIW